MCRTRQFVQSATMALSWARWDTERAGVQAMLFDNRVRDLIVPRLLGVISGRTTLRFRQYRPREVVGRRGDRQRTP